MQVNQLCKCFLHNNKKKHVQETGSSYGLENSMPILKHNCVHNLVKTTKIALTLRRVFTRLINSDYVTCWHHVARVTPVEHNQWMLLDTRDTRQAAAVHKSHTNSAKTEGPYGNEKCYYTIKPDCQKIRSLCFWYFRTLTAQICKHVMHPRSEGCYTGVICNPSARNHIFVLNSRMVYSNQRITNWLVSRGNSIWV